MKLEMAVTGPDWGGRYQVIMAVPKKDEGFCGPGGGGTVMMQQPPPPPTLQF